MDEADAISRIPESIRQAQAYENLRRLSVAQSGASFSYFVLATSPAFFEISQKNVGWTTGPDIVTAVERLTDDQLHILALRIWQLHQDVYAW